MQTSESIKEIAAALATAQGAIQPAKKDIANTFFKSKYADLASVWDACRAALSANGLSVVQMTEQSEKDEVVILTRLLHSSGEWIEGRLAMPVVKADAQGFGSAMTYARRYALAAAVGVAPEDDDANAAAAAKPSKLPAAIPANVEGHDAYSKMPAEMKDYIAQQVASIKGLFNQNGDMAGYIAAQEYDTETELALWTQLPSLIRTKIKEQQKRVLAEQS